MDVFLQIMVSGFVVGGIYSLVALGFVLIYKSSDAINFAQGEFLLIGAYVSLTLIATYHVPLIPALIITLLFSAALGLAIERLVLRPFIKIGEGLGGAIKPTPSGVGYMAPSQQTFVPSSSPMVS